MMMMMTMMQRSCSSTPSRRRRRRQVGATPAPTTTTTTTTTTRRAIDDDHGGGKRTTRRSHPGSMASASRPRRRRPALASVALCLSHSSSGAMAQRELGRVTLDSQVAHLLGSFSPFELGNCTLSHLYLIRFDEAGLLSAYGLESQRTCKGNRNDHKRDRKVRWAKQTVQRIREATAVLETSPPHRPINRVLSSRAALWWADDFMNPVNNLFEHFEEVRRRERQGQVGPATTTTTTKHKRRRRHAEQQATRRAMAVAEDDESLLDDTERCALRMFVFTANASQPCQILVPALFEYDIAHEQVYKMRKSEAISIPWILRKPQVFYRGKDYAPESCSMYFPRNYRPRRKLALISKQYPELINASIYKGSYVDQGHHAKYRYIVDIGGISCTTWSALHWKLMSGSLILVVEHPGESPSSSDLRARPRATTIAGGLENWWSRHKLKPWVHYVPIRPDYADLFDIVSYFEHHVEEAVEIATRGQRAALEYTQTTAYDALANQLLDAAHPPDAALLPYDHLPPRDVWYCAVGIAAECEIRFF